MTDGTDPQRAGRRNAGTAETGCYLCASGGGQEPAKCRGEFGGLHLKRGDIQCYLWRRVVVSCDEAENAFVYAMMELAAGIVWFLPKRKRRRKNRLAKYEGDRIEKVGAKDWMEQD